MAPHLDLTAQSPPARMPKLKYRNPLPSDPNSPSSPDSQNTGNGSAYLQDRANSLDSKTASTSSRPSFETASLTSPSLASASSSTTCSNGSTSSKKKKKASSVFNFLSLKEPSQVALEQFAEQQRKQNSKGTSTPVLKAGSNYIAQKLPANVPKVNSKWDGVPSSTRSWCTTSGSSKSHRSSWVPQTSFGSPHQHAPSNDSRFSVITDGSRNPPNSIASAATSMSNLTIREEDSSHRSSPSTTTLPEMSYYFPDAPATSGASPSNSHRVDKNHKAAARLSESTLDSRPSMDEYVDSRPDSPASDTDSVDTVVRDTADTIFKKLNATPAVQFPGEGKPEHVPDSHDFLFSSPPVVERPKSEPYLDPPPIQHYSPTRPIHNFSRPMTVNTAPTIQRLGHKSSQHKAPQRKLPSAPTLPTLYEASLASTDSLVTAGDDSDAHSTAPSTIAPSELSNHWYESPRERLGLGRRLQINDASPWGSQGQGETVEGRPKKNRLSIFGLGTPRT
ncbi:hypothetical protein EJ02DRAFT_350428 [Clathrospora elynae]|uniref:Uncharacterized protein n=1 Tax=Clathrospora elynae TaxID=706981 RepID=A0A6A5SLE7_9PLEO|nr:hypothetical protein EJ02DRAFT_350428 [Clathrospora elynae]